jgi:DNA sulfur modification protein DndC
MVSSIYQDIKNCLCQLYLNDDRPWLVGFSGGKDSALLTSLIFNSLLSLPSERRRKQISVVCTDTQLEIHAIVDMVEGTLEKMRKGSEQHGLGLDVNLLKPPSEQSFWVNIIGRGYPPPKVSLVHSTSDN